jgi:predicted ATPase with chaperone activity
MDRISWLRRLKWNPPPCGYYGDMKRQCRFSPRQIEQYRQRISGPLLDRIDIHCEVPLVDFLELSSHTATGDKSETIRERVVAARHIQTERFRKSSNRTNSSMSPRQMKLHCQINAEATGYLEHAMEEMCIWTKVKFTLFSSYFETLNLGIPWIFQSGAFSWRSLALEHGRWQSG